MAAVLFAEEHRTRQIRGFHDIEINQIRGAQTQKGKVFDDFVAQRARADDQNPGFAQPLLSPPRNQAQPTITVLVVDQ